MLVVALRRVLADTFMMYIHAHIAHWNIAGPLFPQYHAFLGDLYGELWVAVDGIAEHIRVCRVNAPGTLDALTAPAVVPDQDPGSEWGAICDRLIADNLLVITGLNEAFDAATAAGDQGIADFIAGRLDVHAKHQWMLRSSR